MRAQTSMAADCCDSACQCSDIPSQAQAPTARINGIALHEPGRRPDPAALREAAYAELLRQHAVTKGLLPHHPGATAPELAEAERKIIEAMVDGEVLTPQPTGEEGRRYHEAHKPQFTIGQALHLRHILFAVTPGVNVQALTVHAERALLELTHKSAHAERFAQLAAELSNCPSGAQGGDLGWIGPDDCAPELATELFHLKYAQTGTGVHPRLFHTRFGFHIIDVLERRSGRQPEYEEVRERITDLLTMQSRAKALHQFMTLLVGEALVEGVELEGADSPLVQ